MVTQNRYRRSPGERRANGQPVELELRGGAYQGRMVARQSLQDVTQQDDTEAVSGGKGRVVFVDGGIPGETVRAELTVEKKAFAEGRALRIVSPAASRVAPPCPYFGENGVQRGAVPTGNALPGERGACGGCQYQHIDYGGQLALKRDIVADLMRRQARLPDVEVRPTIASPAPWRYRNRTRWIVDDDGRPCYHQSASDRLLPVALCHIVQPVLDDILGQLAGPDWRLPLRTLVSEITARTAIPWTEDDDPDGPPQPSVLLALHARQGAKRRDLKMFAGDLGAALPALDGVTLSAALMAGAQPGSGGGLWGVDHFDARFAGFRFRLSPLTFFQVNEPTAAVLVDLVMELLGDLRGKSVLDIYAGAGTFTLPIAARAEQVLAMENDALAVDDAQLSARANRLANVHVMPGDAADELEGLPIRAGDAAVLDPPRAGVDERVIAELDRIKVPRIVYVSCDPATLARDLRRFTDRGYAVESIQPIDLFPQTFHIETVVALSRA